MVLKTDLKKPLFVTFLIEIGVGIAALFYSLFGIKRKEKNTSSLPSDIKTEFITDVDVVTDSPLESEFQLNKPVALLESYNSEIKSMITSNEFSGKYMPSMIVFTSNDDEYQMKPSIVIQFQENTLPALNMTLADFMDSGHSLTREIQNIVGTRKVRVGSHSALQWYRAELTNIFGIPIDAKVEYTQFQKNCSF